MGTGYTRNDTVNNIADGNIINASDLDGEFDAVQAAFDAATGHTHDGTTGEGAPIEVTGPAQEYVSTGTEFRPKSNNTYDLGSSGNQWKDLYVDGTANLDAVDIDGGNIDGTVIGGSTPAAISGTTITGTSFVSSGNMTFGDGDSAFFGDSNDLQIVHNGSHSYIADSGTGNLYIQTTAGLIVQNSSGTETMATFTENGAVDLYHDNALKLSTTATGIDVTGTVTADGLTVGIGDVIGVNAGNGFAIDASSNIDFTSGGVKSLRIREGDISFYEDTGTTPKFFWDASAERLGIGTTSPQDSIHISQASAVLRLEDTDTSHVSTIQSSAAGLILTADAPNTVASSFLAMAVDGSERMRITSTGSVGIGTSSPTHNLTVGGTAASDFVVALRGGVGGFFGWDDSANSTILQSPNTRSLAFQVNSDTFSAGTEAMRITSTGNVGIGTSAPSGFLANKLVVATGGTANEGVTIYSSSNNGSIWFADATTGNGRFAGGIDYQHATNELVFYTNSQGNVRIDSSGNVGIGTSSPESKLAIKGSSGSADLFSISDVTVPTTGTEYGVAMIKTNSTEYALNITGYNTSSKGVRIYANGADAARTLLSVERAAGTALVVDGLSNVGIGTNSPAYKLQVNGGNATNNNDANTIVATGTNHVRLKVHTPTTGGYRASLVLSSDEAVTATGNEVSISTTGSDEMQFATAGTERARIDASGNLLVGDTSTTFNDTAKTVIRPSADNWTIKPAICHSFNRTGSDGDIFEFYRGSATKVGTIGAASSRLAIGTSNVGAYFASGGIAPWNTTTNAARDNAIDLGSGSARWKDLYLSGGVVFGATGGAVSSKTLDDYEEGTWTPALSFDGASVGITYVSRYGRYTKIGNLVSLSSYFFLSNKGTSTGSARLEGLPFAAVNETGNYVPAVFWAAQLSHSGSLQAYVALGQTYVQLQEVTDGGLNSNLNQADVASNTEIMIQLSYRTSS